MGHGVARSAPGRTGVSMIGAQEVDACAALADRIEAEAWRAMYAAAPLGVIDAVGLCAREVAEGSLFLATHMPVGIFNRVIGLGGEQRPSDEDVEAVIETARRARATTLWVQAIAGSALASLLERRGTALAPRRSWAKMLHVGVTPTIESSLRIDAMAPDEAPEVARVLVAAHGLPPSLAPWFEALTRQPGFRAYAAYDRGRIVAGGMLHLGEHGAWIGFGGTLPSARGRGAQAALMARRIADARAQGRQAIASETFEPNAVESNPAFANMKRCGFEQVASRLNFVAF